ncbi:hypothetical protein D3C87_39550 [compost metagenome]
MSQKYSLLLLSSFVLVITSCKIQEQARSIDQIFSPAINGNASLTLSGLDSLDKVRNPLLNWKYQKLKKKFYQRFSDDTEKTKRLSKNKVVNDVCNFYQDYWKIKLLSKPLNCDSILYDKLAHYLVDNKLTEIPFDSLSKTINDDSELTKVLEKEGFHSKFLFLNGVQDALIWDKQSQSEYAVDLLESKLVVKVIFIENYVLRGVAAYASFNGSQIGGWASNADSSIYCNKGAYKLKSETFKYSYLKHEAIHFVDIPNYPNLESADLEYRAKLIELIYCTKKTIYKRLDEFIIEASNETRDNSHPYADYHLISQLSKKLFNVDFEGDISKWKMLTPEEINNASMELFRSGSELLKSNPNRDRIIEDVYQFI